MGVDVDLMDAAISRFGVVSQIKHQVEEASEVVTAFLQFERDPENEEKRTKLMEELVDNYLMAIQMEYIFRHDEGWKKHLSQKQRRLRKRMETPLSKPSSRKTMDEILEDYGEEWKS